ncbi:MAG TPA: SAM-dependent methyltransferase, partial [Candidatus Polarisedimenticolia bacterium]|nr:SAM-dependent methyltransferase [Candidatus Polarisedimenticolia bacterium]
MPAQTAGPPRRGILFVVATPIGNLEDLSPRALSALAQCGLIACEDTRTTRKLLTRHGLHARLLSCHVWDGRVGDRRGRVQAEAPELRRTVEREGEQNPYDRAAADPARHEAHPLAERHGLVVEHGDHGGERPLRVPVDHDPVGRALGPGDVH